MESASFCFLIYDEAEAIVSETTAWLVSLIVACGKIRGRGMSAQFEFNWKRWFL